MFPLVPTLCLGITLGYITFSKQLSLDKTQEGLKFEEVEYVRGLENPSEFPNIVRWLVKHGYSDDEITKAIGGNTLRVLKQVWK